VAQIRQHWSEVRIVQRAYPGFCREELLRWCEDNGVEHVFGLARNGRLRRQIEKALRKAAAASKRSGKAARAYTEFRDPTLKSWSRQRRVVAKAERIEGKENPRCLVTSLKGADATIAGEISGLAFTGAQPPRSGSARDDLSPFFNRGCRGSREGAGR
jgi:hypothetical protein